MLGHMTQQLTVQVQGFGEIQAQEGERLVLALERGGVDVLHRCGGVARCTTCRVSFEEGEPDAMTAAEFDKLTEKGLLGQARLSCQIECAPGVSSVTAPSCSRCTADSGAWNSSRSVRTRGSMRPAYCPTSAPSRSASRP